MVAGRPVIQFQLDRHSGLPPYRQVVDQVRHAVQLGALSPRDQLPTVREVVKQIAINPNTVHRAYRDLAAQGITEGRRGSGTFIRHDVTAVSFERGAELESELKAWMSRARDAGMNDEAISALVVKAMHSLVVKV